LHTELCLLGIIPEAFNSRCLLKLTQFFCLSIYSKPIHQIGDFFAHGGQSWGEICHQCNPFNNILSMLWGKPQPG